MSAIAGFWAYDSAADPVGRCEALLDSLHPYGPEGRRCARLGDYAAGTAFTRLLPQDSNDRQPLIAAEGRYALAADVRIDNRDELAEALGLPPAEARDGADSEILLAALMRWGEAALERIVGDFAFAFFDAAARSLLLARDPLGQRSLFWCSVAGAIAFASMPEALVESGLAGRRPDEEALARYLIGLPQAGTASFHADISRVPPAHKVSIKGRAVQIRRYWRPAPAQIAAKSFDDYVDAYRFELDRAVACRLRGAEAPLAAHLSGGWDSSAVTATAARLVAPEKGRVLAFTSVPSRAAGAAGPPDRFSDEGPLAAKTAALHGNVEHVLLESTLRSPVGELDFYARIFNRPVYNLYNQSWLADIRAAARARGAKVLLTGEMGNWTISAAPNNALAEFVSAGRWLSWGREASAMLRQKRARLRGVVASSFSPWVPAPLWRKLRRYSSAPQPHKRTALHPRLLPRLLAVEDRRDLGPGGRPRTRLERMTALFDEVDFGEYRKGALGGWGVDERDPTADRRLIEFSLGLPLDMLLSRGERRPLARAALADRLPADVLTERRKGYQASDWGEALTRDLPSVRDLVRRIAGDEGARALIDADLLQDLVENWPAGGWNRSAVMGLYRSAFLDALTAGHFILGRGAAPQRASAAAA
jgi:asparagine synthase (glutamine-hydrolysing)